MSELSELRAHNAALVDRLREAVDWVEKLNADNKRKTAYVEDAMGELRTAIKNAEAATTDVTGCADCPAMVVVEGDGHIPTRELCGLDDVAHRMEDRHRHEGDMDTPAPDWCPLRKDPITIRLVTK